MEFVYSFGILEWIFIIICFIILVMGIYLYTGRYKTPPLIGIGFGFIGASLLFGDETLSYGLKIIGVLFVMFALLMHFTDWL